MRYIRQDLHVAEAVERLLCTSSHLLQFPLPIPDRLFDRPVFYLTIALTPLLNLDG